MKRPTLRAAVATVAAAVVLVAGADLASYAATGKPLILGHKNSAVGTTSLKNIGRGPALSLNSAKNVPPLLVNSKKMVKHLNANLVGGQTAAQLNPKLLRWHLGAVGTTFANGASDLFKVTVPKGTYQVTLSGLLVQSGASTTDSWQCLAVDYHKLLDNPSSPDISGIWALGGHQWSDWDAAVLDYTSAPITLTQPRAMLYGCQFSGTTGTITAYQPPTFVFHKVTVANQTQGSPVVLPKSATSHLRLPR